ncbi:MAG: SpoIIE family protein phosphatase [Spirochaetota bacterium]
MNARFVNQVIGSPVLAKLILLACVAAIFLYLRRKDTEGHSSAFLALLGILAVRDFLSAYYFSPDLFLISDLFYLSFAIYILLAPHDGSRMTLVLAIGFNIVMTALFVGMAVFDLPINLPGRIFGYVLVVDVSIAGLIAFNNRKDRSTSARHLVSLLWPVAVLFLLAYTVLAVVLGYDDTLFLGLVMPLSYGWLLAAALLSLGIQEAELVTALVYYEAAIDSLHTMFLSTASALEAGIPGQEVLERLNEMLVSETGADGGIILLPDGDESVTVKAYAGFFPPLLPMSERLPRTAEDIETYMKRARFGFGEGIFGDVAKTGKNVYSPVAERDPRFIANGSDDFMRISSFMAVPLMIEDRILGVSALVRTSTGSAFQEADFDRFKLLANFGSFAVSAVLSSYGIEDGNRKNPIPGSEGTEGAIKVVQQSILPRRFPLRPGLSVDAMTIPATGSAGAYYDFILARKDRIIGVVAEAGGQGLRAALVLVMLRSVLHVLGGTDKGMAAVLDWTNRVLHGSIDNDQTVSIGLVCLNLQTGELEYTNAGRLALLVYKHGTRAIDYIYKASVPIGKERVAGHERIRLQLQAGDMMVLYTDGVTGCMDNQGNRFGRKALASTIAGFGESRAQEVIAGIRGALSVWAGTAMQQDDQTVLVIKVG